MPGIIHIFTKPILSLPHATTQAEGHIDAGWFHGLIAPNHMHTEPNSCIFLYRTGTMLSYCTPLHSIALICPILGPPKLSPVYSRSLAGCRTFELAPTEVQLSTNGALVTHIQTHSQVLLLITFLLLARWQLKPDILGSHLKLCLRLHKMLINSLVSLTSLLITLSV